MSAPKNSPPPAPEVRESSDTREKILASAHEIIGAKGFNGCGLNEILKKAGVPKGSFYHHFASKEALGVALIERARDEHLDLMSPILADWRRTPLQRLRAVFDLGYEECKSSGMACECLISKLALETSRLSDPVHAAVQLAFQQWRTMLAQVLREAQVAGELPKASDTDQLASALVMLWEGATIRMQIERSLQPLDECLAFVFGTLLPAPAPA